MPKSLQRLADRIPVGVSRNKITAFTGFGLENFRRLSKCQTYDEQIGHFLWAGFQFCQLVTARGFDSADAVYTFDRAGLEVLRAAKERGIRTVMEQTVAPLAIDRKWAEEEINRYPGWCKPTRFGDNFLRFIDREQAEWELADLILCGSEFVRQAIRDCCGPVERCAVVSYGVDARFQVPERTPHNGPLRVLTIGEVGLRKGAPYVLAIAEKMRGGAEFRMVGDINLSRTGSEYLRREVDLVASVPRSEIPSHYAWADVFLLPSLCEGSATVTYEALSAGLPVICTANTGSVVRDGVDGYIVNARDVNGAVEILETIAADRDRLAELSINAVKGAQDFSITSYQQRHVNALRGLWV